MAKKPTVTSITSGYASNTQLNNNFVALRDGFDNTISRDGSTPNTMEADLDLNSNDLLNAKEVRTQYLYINGQLVSTGGVSSAGPADVTVNRFVGNGTTTSYTLSKAPLGKSATFVFVDGVSQEENTYSLSSTSLLFTEAPPLNSHIEVRAFSSQELDLSDSSSLYRDLLSGDGSTTEFTLDATPVGQNNSFVFISGVYQQKTAYTLVGNTLTFSSAPPSGTGNIEVMSIATTPLGSTTSDLVTHSQGSVGSASRTVQNRLQETVSIKDFGAVGDGNADDTTAFDNALTAARAAGKPLYLPKGIYKRTTALLLQDGDSFIGDGWQESTIEFEPPTTLGACIVPEDDTNFTDFCRFEHLRIIGKASNTALTPIGLWGKSFRTSRFVHCEFNYFSQNCVYLYGQRTALGALDPGDSTYNYFEQCRFLSGVDPVRLGGTAGSPDRIDSGTSNINTFIRCRFASATRYGTWLEQGSSNTFVACSWVANADSGIRVGWYGNTWTGCVAENNGAYGIRFDNEAETHDNWVFGMHDGGSNVSGLFQDQNNESYWFASNRGLKFGTESGGLVDNLSAYAKTDGHLYWQDNNGNAARISNNGGALVNLNANKNTASGTPYLIPFNSETYDDDGFHSTVANVTRLTIPADGVSRVRLTANVEWASNATGYRQIAILKNGTSVLGGGSLRQDALSSNGNIMNLCSGPIAVSPGDYFEIEATQTSGGSLIISNTNNTFFSIEVLR